jgi:hypothetical protein
MSDYVRANIAHSIEVLTGFANKVMVQCDYRPLPSQEQLVEACRTAIGCMKLLQGTVEDTEVRSGALPE